MFRAFLLALTLVCLIFAQSGLVPASAKSKKAKGANSEPICESQKLNLITIPVFFISDRNREPCKDKDNLVKFGHFRQYRGTCGHDPHLGIAYCTISNTQDKCLDQQKLCNLGWKSEHKRGEGAYQVSLIDGCTYEEGKEKFYEDVYKSAADTEDKELFVFAPGYMSTFESGLKEAARFAYYSERPVILYSWPSKGTFKGYSSDEATIEWSQEHFNEMIEALTEFSSRKTPVATRLIAHSMGSRLIMRAVPLIKGKEAFREIALVCPDVDAGVVKHYITKCMTNSGTTVRLYMSHKDRMLALSKLVHGGYERLGQDQALVPSSPYKAIDSCAGKLSPETLKRFQTIDFTELDGGKLGHKIPVSLVCSLSRTGNPPDGIELIHKQNKDSDSSEIMMLVSDIDTDERENLLGYFLVHRCQSSKFPVASAVKNRLPKLPVIKKDWTIK